MSHVWLANLLDDHGDNIERGDDLYDKVMMSSSSSSQSSSS